MPVRGKERFLRVSLIHLDLVAAGRQVENAKIFRAAELVKNLRDVGQEVSVTLSFFV